MSPNLKITAVAVILTALASPSFASSQKSHRHSAHDSAAYSSDREGFGAPGSTPNGYYRSSRQKHSHKTKV
jgi:hypothetical protein